MSYNVELEDLFVGKKVTANLIEMAEDNVEFEWDCNWPEDGNNELAGGCGHVNTNYRDYMSGKNVDDDDDDDDDDGYDERYNWRISTGIDFVVSNEGIIERINITANVWCHGDSGLGDCDPDDEWIDDDFECAKEFLEMITESQEETGDESDD